VDEAVLTGEDLRETMLAMIEEDVERLADEHLGTDPDAEALIVALEAVAPGSSELDADELESMSVDEASDAAIAVAERIYDELEEQAGEETQRFVESYTLLSTIDALWVSHLTAMDEMRQGIGLRAYGQSDPLVAYKREAHDMYEQLSERIRQTVARNIFHTRLNPAEAKHLLGEHTPQRITISGPAEPGTDDDVPVTATANGHSEEAAAEALDPNASRADRRRAERQQKKTSKRTKSRR